MNIKTIDITAKEWFDKINGNSYFSAVVTLNYGMPSEKIIKVPFQYGYGDQFIPESYKILNEHNYISSCVELTPLWRYCQNNNIILRTIKIENCTKKETKLFGE